MTLAVNPLGEGDKRGKHGVNSCIYLLTSALSGAFSGILISMIVYLSTIWIPFIVKLYILLVVIFIYVLKEFGLINVPSPQSKWQIPQSWVSYSPITNMVIWGSILGAGIFTYNPHISFFIIYLYTGFFLSPVYGFWFGITYGFARALSSILIANLDNKARSIENEKSSFTVVRIWSMEKWFKLSHSTILLSLFIYLINTLFRGF